MFFRECKVCTYKPVNESHKFFPNRKVRFINRKFTAILLASKAARKFLGNKTNEKKKQNIRTIPNWSPIKLLYKKNFKGKKLFLQTI